MSGGSFDYAFHRIEDMADKLAEKIAGDETEDSTGCAYHHPDTIARLKRCEHLIRIAAKLAREVEWFYSGDTGEDSFAQRMDQICKGL